MTRALGQGHPAFSLQQLDQAPADPNSLFLLLFSCSLRLTRVAPPQVVSVAKQATPSGEERSSVGYLLRLHLGAGLSHSARPAGCAQCISYTPDQRGGSELLLITFIHKCEGILLQAKEQWLLLALPCLQGRCLTWLQRGRIVLQDICGSLHCTASSNTQSACESVNFHLRLFFLFQSRPHPHPLTPPPNRPQV